MVWYFHLFQNLPEFIVIHTVKPEIGGFLFVGLFVFYGIILIFKDPRLLALGSLVILPFLKPVERLEVHGSYISEAWLGEL